jgi:4-hydroxythreonine-4-phosphate dehydrogenase
MEKPIVGFTTGDINGIGIELIIKVLSDARILDMCMPVVFASNKVINYYRRTVSDCTFNFNSIKSFDQINPKQVSVFNCWDEEVNIQPGSLNDIGGKYAIRSLIVAAQCLKDRQINALVTAPIHKSNTHTNDFNYTGHTPFFKDKFGAKDVVMLLYNQLLKVALVTEHIPVKEVAENITAERISTKVQILNDSLVKDFGIDKPRIAILGLNPHAGDGGLIGKEEQETITPAIKKLQEQGQLVFGPYSADAFFARNQHIKFDAVLAMYHDQGLIPFKYIADEGGVNYTCGLPVIRTSPDHGTAFDIAGQNIASPDSMRTALFEAISIYRQRSDFEHYTANPIKRHSLSTER